MSREWSVTLLNQDRSIRATMKIHCQPTGLIEFGGRYYTPCMSGTNEQLHGIGIYIETECLSIRSEPE